MMRTTGRNSEIKITHKSVLLGLASWFRRLGDRRIVEIEGIALCMLGDCWVPLLSGIRSPFIQQRAPVR